MSYICLDCGHIFEDGEQATYKEDCGECWGHTVYKSYSCCPVCGGEYEESTPCAICGSEQLEENLNGGLCDECIDKYKNDIDMCFKIGKNDADKVELNCFLASVFEKSEIEELLFEELKKRNSHVKVDCEKFMNSDRSWFAERLLEELEKEKK
jgi:RecJ-like exonuclease